MPKASVKRLIDNRKDKLIDFVLDIEKYPEFIPFCDSSKVYERNDDDETTPHPQRTTRCVHVPKPSVANNSPRPCAEQLCT